MFLALTGTRISAADALYCGIATHYVPAASFPALQSALANTRNMDDAIREYAEPPPGEPELAQHRAHIDRIFAHDRLETIITALEEEGNEWAAQIRATILGKSPVSSKVALRQLREGAQLDFHACMKMEYRLASRFIEGRDFYEGVRATVIIALAIPVSLLAAVLIMYFMGYTLNTMTMLALLLLIGVVVDDAIVVLENIHRHMHERPGDPHRAAAEGTQQVYFAIVAATFALVCIFGPVIFMEGVIGLFFESFAVVVTTGVLASLFVAVTLTPMLCSRLLKVEVHQGRLARASFAAMDRVEAAYRRSLDWVLRRRWLTVVLAVLVVLPAVWLFGVIGKTFEPDVDESGFLVTFKTPLGSSLAYSERRMQEVEALLKAQPEVRDYWSAVGLGPLGQVSQGMVFVRLLPDEEREAHAATVIGVASLAIHEADPARRDAPAGVIVDVHNPGLELPALSPNSEAQPGEVHVCARAVGLHRRARHERDGASEVTGQHRGGALVRHQRRAGGDGAAGRRALDVRSGALTLSVLRRDEPVDLAPFRPDRF